MAQASARDIVCVLLASWETRVNALPPNRPRAALSELMGSLTPLSLFRPLAASSFLVKPFPDYSEFDYGLGESLREHT